ncbi:MAG: hypothetical protein B6242_11440 [Anaerolineaceae bacterium 4572_78]|nr:MAG: hypothetical protein B6242_11440 [Anaerolineaceae bacterium 4572_78]
MLQKISLKYGHQTIQYKLPEHADILRVQDPEKVITETLFHDRLIQEFEQLHADYARVAISIADKTRVCDYHVYLPILLQTLEECGAKKENITLYVAYGTHAPQSDSTSLKIYGEVYNHYRFVAHACHDKNNFVELGQTKRGTPVRIRHDIYEASFLITFGAISHHYFAGYGGGRKLIFPGLGEKEAIYHNHGLFLDREANTLSVSCQPGLLTGNPLAEDLAEIETYRPADMAIHGILNSKGQVYDLLVGHGHSHFLKACAKHDDSCRIDTAQGYDVVLISCGGNPKDINFIQSHKAIHHASFFVDDGGDLIVLTECPDGIGSTTFLPWFELDGWQQMFDKLAKHYVGNGGTALAMMEKLGRINIHIVTEIGDATSRKIGFNKISISESKAMLKKVSSSSMAVIENASLSVRSPMSIK